MYFFVCTLQAGFQTNNWVVPLVVSILISLEHFIKTPMLDGLVYWVVVGYS